MTKIGVMHLIDTLDMGGAEKTAVNLVNRLPRDQFNVTLCSTRRDGVLAPHAAGDVTRLCLSRRHRFDLGAVRRLNSFIREKNIKILHAHASSLFIARVAAAMPPFPKLIWHDHYGRADLNDRPVWLYRAATRGISAILSVNNVLADWARRQLGMRTERVWYVPNFVTIAPVAGGKPDLPGIPGQRIVCVANMRPQKDHMNLIRAMQIIVAQAPAAHLILVGVEVDREYSRQIRDEIRLSQLDGNVTMLGIREDVPAVLKACDVGVLSSISEGLPLALLDYGMTGLPAVATAVGQCPEVLDGGSAGILVPPRSPESLAQAVLFLLESPKQRTIFGNRLHEHVRESFDPDSITEQISCIYHTIAEADRRTAK